MRARFGIGLLLWLIASVAYGVSYDVKRVVDGDTLHVINRYQQSIKIRLAFIDAPERDQPFFKESTDMLRSMVRGQKVSLQIVDVDRYKRVVAVVYVGDTDINKAMIEQGGAQVYERYNKDPSYVQAQRDAADNRLGLWALKEVKAPWEYRAVQRKLNEKVN